jgi:hypothetical protein
MKILPLAPLSKIIKDFAKQHVKLFYCFTGYEAETIKALKTNDWTFFIEELNVDTDDLKIINDNKTQLDIISNYLDKIIFFQFDDLNLYSDIDIEPKDYIMVTIFENEGEIYFLSLSKK